MGTFKVARVAPPMASKPSLASTSQVSIEASGVMGYPSTCDL